MITEVYKCSKQVECEISKNVITILTKKETMKCENWVQVTIIIALKETVNLQKTILV